MATNQSLGQSSEQPTAQQAESTPLHGIKVLDFGRYIAGPACASLLGSYGAEVIRIEQIRGGEDRWMTPVTPGGEGSMFCQLAGGKRSLAMNPFLEEGKEIVSALLAQADVVVANLPEAGLEALGLDWERLHALNPRAVLVSNTAFGTSGPMAELLGFDGLAQALSGVMALTGPAEAPVKAYPPFVDFCTACLAAFGTMTALRSREQTGLGQRVQTALYHSALYTMSATLIEQSLRGVNRVASMNRGQTAGPADCYRCVDGWVLVQVLGPKQFKRWAELVDHPELLEDPRFESDLDRGNNSELLGRIMGSWCADQRVESVLAKMAEVSIPAAVVRAPAQTLEDEQAKAMGYFAPVAMPSMDETGICVTTPVRLSDTPPLAPQPAPLLGEHNDEILGELGYDSEAIARLRAASVVA